MTAAKELRLLTVEEYLAAEIDSEVRHEYLGGYLYAMAGGKNAHGRIAVNFLISLGTQLKGKACEAFNSDTKVRIEFANHTRFYYPDGMIVCESNSPDDTFQDHPVILAEVLSDSTRRNDEGEKREAYLTIPSLRVYLLIEQDKPQVAVYRRADQEFKTELYEGLDAVIPLSEVEAELPLAELYERIEFKPGD